MLSFRPSRRLILLVAPLVAALIVVLALGGASAGAKTTIRLKAIEKGGLKFNKKTLHTSAGKVTFVMSNPKGNKFPHAIAVEGNGLDKDGKHVTAGKTSTVTVTLKKGRTYEFYCPVDGHRKAGMEGKITVS